MRREALLTAARDEFLARGYEGTTVAAIVARAGGSKRTVYELFGDKAGLFAEIVADLCRNALQPLGDDHIAESAPADALRAFARAYMGILMDPSGLALYRMVTAEALRFPELGHTVFRSGPDMASERLATRLRGWAAAGVLDLPDPDAAARQFLEMIKGDLHMRALFGSAQAPEPAEIDACVQSAVELFLQGARPRRSPEGQATRRSRPNAAHISPDRRAPAR